MFGLTLSDLATRTRPDCHTRWVFLRHSTFEKLSSLLCFHYLNPFRKSTIGLNSDTVSLFFISTFKKKAPKAIKEIRKFAQKAMGTTDVRVDVKLNKHIWSRGIRSVPRRVRVRIARKRNDDEDAKEELYSLVTVAEIPAEGLKGLGTKVIDDED